jgi:hypothetical protein
MIKSDAPITETAINLPPVNLRNNLNTSLSTGEAKSENPLGEKVNDKLIGKTHFTRLKRRLRCRASSIF